MSVLHQRYPKIYTEDQCITCRSEIETQDHLAKCTLLQKVWEDNEVEVFKEALEDKKLDWGPEQKRKWETIWAGNSDENRKKRRKLLLQGLVPVMKQEESPTEIKEKNEIFERMNDKFMEKIWKPRCEAVTEWEKERNIKKVRKRKADGRVENTKEVESQRKRKKANSEKVSQGGPEVEDKPLGKFEKMVKEAKRILGSWIEGAMRPFWMSSAKPRKIRE
jgi:hypothetical protein